ncbi:helix-turn-helix transcriptional regulator [Hafnia alvei]|uniref:helix-turn-helix domain-containing protein n=1 Tax=Hafnia alvei TaxID=569 RepID=UPI000C9FC31B|nr:helix-turn-helix transcriptional regulator [Hafnia alvei]MBI0278506.1 helix-turn-helix transcriptional regulator [Hafnia alvei]PNL03674.1 transcriptional regulator [Hafnia alvei]
MNHSEKLKAIRKAEDMTQDDFSKELEIGLGTIKNYETGQRGVGVIILDKVTNHPRFKKYTMWLMTGDTAPEIGQISPALSPDGSSSISNHQKGQKAG